MAPNLAARLNFALWWWEQEEVRVPGKPGGGWASVLCGRWRKPREEALAPAEAPGRTGA